MSGRSIQTDHPLAHTTRVVESPKLDLKNTRASVLYVQRNMPSLKLINLEDEVRVWGQA